MQYVVDFVVIKGEGKTLLCRKTAEELNLLRVGPFQVNNMGNVHAGIDIQEKYKNLFTGVCLLVGYDLKLNIDESVTPVAQPIRRVPFG